MDSSPLVSQTQFKRASHANREKGLLGWVKLQLGEWDIDAITVRSTLDGRVTLSYREHKDASGRRHPIAWPRDKHVRRALEQRIIRDLRKQGFIR